MKNSKKVAVCAVLAALSVVLLFVGSASQILDLSCAAFASIIIMYIFIEIGGAWPYLTYAAVSLLSLLILPDKFAAVVYLLFAGYYPMIKLTIEKHTRTAVGFIFKIIIFNLALTGVILISKFILLLPDDEIGLKWIVYASANAAFILFDVALTRLISLYLYRLRKRFKIK